MRYTERQINRQSKGGREGNARRQEKKERERRDK